MGFDEDMRELYDLHAEAEAPPPRLHVVVDAEAWAVLCPRVHRLTVYRHAVRVPRLLSVSDVPEGVEAVGTVASDPVLAALEVLDDVDLSAWSGVVAVATDPRAWRPREGFAFERPRDVA